MVKDAVGIELNEGDRVAYVRPYFRAVQLGTIMYLTPCGARIMSDNTDYEFNRFSNQMIKVVDGK